MHVQKDNNLKLKRTNKRPKDKDDISTIGQCMAFNNEKKLKRTNKRPKDKDDISTIGQCMVSNNEKKPYHIVAYKRHQYDKMGNK